MEPLQRSRYERVFDGYVDEEGFFTRASLSGSARTLAKVRGQDPDSPEVVELSEELGRLWDSLAASADTDQDGRVSRDEWCTVAETLTTMLQAAPPDAEWPMDPWIKLLYRVIDADGDGSITQQEYADWLTALGLAADTDIDKTFAILDTDGDGGLSWEEFSEYSRQYWTDFDPSLPGHHWIGPS